MFSTLKVKKEQKLRVGSTQKHNKVTATPNQPIKSKKKYVKYLIRGKEPKIPMEATRQNSPGGLKNNKTQVEFKKS
jgi:hypothetical protein